MFEPHHSTQDPSSPGQHFQKALEALLLHHGTSHAPLFIRSWKEALTFLGEWFEAFDQCEAEACGETVRLSKRQGASRLSTPSTPTSRLLDLDKKRRTHPLLSGLPLPEKVESLLAEWAAQEPSRPKSTPQRPPVQTPPPRDAGDEDGGLGRGSYASGFTTTAEKLRKKYEKQMRLSQKKLILEEMQRDMASAKSSGGNDPLGHASWLEALARTQGLQRGTLPWARALMGGLPHESRDALRARYLALVRLWHPDTGPEAPPEAMSALSDAWEILRKAPI